MFYGDCKEGNRVSDSRSRSVVERKKEWMVFLYGRPKGVQKSDKEHLPERAHCVDIGECAVSAHCGQPKAW